jgi:hypothetical protein
MEIEMCKFIVEHFDFYRCEKTWCLTLGKITDRLCGLMVRVPGYRSRDPGFDSRRYKVFWEIVGLEWGSPNLVRITEKLHEWKSSGSRCRKSRLTAVGIRCADHRNTFYPQELALTSPTCGDRSVGIVRLRTKATESSNNQPITVAAIYKAWTVFVHWNTGILDQIPLQAWVSVCVYFVCAVLFTGRGLAADWTLVQGVLLTL